MKQNRGVTIKNRGFIHIILAIIVIVLILTYLKFDLRGVVESDTGQSNFGYLGELLGKMWDWFWAFIKLVLTKFINLFKDLTS